MTDYQTIVVEQSGAVARITLNRPDAANGMNDTMTRELADAAAQCDTAATKVVVITGAGRFFCAGGDLKAISASPLGPGPFVKGIADDLHRAISTFARMDAVLITAVNGIAAGAGFSLAVSGDLVVAGSSAAFTMAYTKAGLSPDGSASYFLPRLIGVRRTQDLMLTNRRLSAGEALDWGLVNYVVDDAELGCLHRHTGRRTRGRRRPITRRGQETPARHVRQRHRDADGTRGTAHRRQRRRPRRP